MADVRDGLHAEPTASHATDAGSAAGRLVVVWEGGAVSRDLPESGTLLVGRALDCDVTVEHASVSRHHARLHVTREGLFIEDLGSANGTRLRGKRLASSARVALASGETVDLGATHLVATRGAPSVPSDALAPLASDAELVVGRTMRELYASLEPIAASDLSILLLGETGAGKDVVAAQIHAASPRRGGPFLAINCAALPETLLESELFGHERGAFSGAMSSKVGLFEAAGGGTVLLDELGEMAVSMQSKLLRALENREVFRVGAVKPRPIDVRFLGATSRDLEALVQAGTFRPDLFYRVSGAVVRVPPLRERVDEIAPLVERFVHAALDRTGRAPPRLGAKARVLLERHPWPGNVRELRNVAERAALICRGPEILPEHLALAKPTAAPLAFTAPPPDNAPPQSTPPSAPAPAPGPGLRSEVEALARKRILETLERCGGNQTRAAKELGISRRALLMRLDEYGVPRPRK